jgi:hypothetical protein
MTLTFILSMRARALSRNWDHHTWLLERTLDSILAQTDPRFNAVVVCHDIPDIPQADQPNVEMLTVDFPVPDRNNDAMCIDKILKVSRGVEWAQAHGSEYVMFVDADDLVSRRLSAWVAANSGGNGWFFRSGYAHCYGDPWMRTQTPHHLICGTGAIVRADLLRFAKVDFCHGRVVNTLAAAGIGNYLSHLAEQGSPIEPLPFPGAIYVLHDDSTSEVPGGSGYRLNGTRDTRPIWRRTLSWGKRTVNTLSRTRPVTSRVRREFSVPRAANVPGAYLIRPPMAY